MGSYGLNHDNAFTTLLSSQAVANSAERTDGPISLDGYIGVEITFEVLYGGTASAPVEFYFPVLIGGTTYQVRADKPFGKAMAANTASTTHYDKIFIPATHGDSVKVITYNPSGAQVTVTIRYKLIAGVTA